LIILIFYGCFLHAIVKLTRSRLRIYLCFRLDIKQVSDGVQHVPGIVEAKVENIKQAWDVLQAGSNARAVGSNNVNERSSRSHWSVPI
jgi:hypothetical protein